MFALTLLIACTEEKTTPAITDTSIDTETTPVPSSETDTGTGTAPIPPPPCGTLLSVRSAPAAYYWGPRVAFAADGGLRLGSAFESTLVMGAGQPNETTLQPVGRRDGWVASESADGTLQWARSIGGAETHVYVSELLATSDGGVVIAGIFDGPELTVSLGQPDAVTLGQVGLDDLWFARFGPDGALLSSQIIGSRGRDGGSVVVFDDGSVAVALRHGVPVRLAAGTPEETTVQLPPGAEDGTVVMRFAPDGALQWVLPVSGTTRSVPSDLAIDPATGDLLVSAFVSGDGQIDLGNSLVLDPLVSKGYLLRLAGDGTPLQVFPTYISGIIGQADDRIFVTGQIDEPVTFETVGAAEIVLELPEQSFSEVGVVAFDGSGGVQWAVQTRSNLITYALESAVAHDGGVVVTGNFALDLRLGEPGSGVAYSTRSDTDFDGFVLHYDANGALVCADQMGSRGFASGSGVAVHPDGTVLITGSFDDAVVLNRNMPQEIEITPSSSSDYFLATYAF